MCHIHEIGALMRKFRSSPINYIQSSGRAFIQNLKTTQLKFQESQAKERARYSSSEN
jgi:hypothetical protein